MEIPLLIQISSLIILIVLLISFFIKNENNTEKISEIESKISSLTKTFNGKIKELEANSKMLIESNIQTSKEELQTAFTSFQKKLKEQGEGQIEKLSEIETSITTSSKGMLDDFGSHKAEVLKRYEDHQQAFLDLGKKFEDLRDDKHFMIQRYLNEIQDYYHVKDRSANYKILGNVNRLRKDLEYPGRIDLKAFKVRGLDLKNYNLSDVDFHQAAFDGCNLEGVDFSNSRLTEIIFSAGQNFQGCTLTGADCSNSFFTNANFTSLDLSQTKFNGATLDGAYFDGTILEKTEFHDAILVNAKMRGTTCIETIFSDANLEEADFQKAKLKHVIATKAKFIDCKMMESVVEGSNFTGTDFTKSNLEGIDWTRGNDLTDAIFYESELTGAKFGISKTSVELSIASSPQPGEPLQAPSLEAMSLQNVNFAKANLTKAIFANTTITISNFKESTLNFTDFKKAQITSSHFEDSEGKETVFYDTDLDDVFFSKAKFEEVDFGIARLKETKFIETKFVKCDFSGIDGEKIDFNGADFFEGELRIAKFEESDFSKVKFEKVKCVQAQFLNKCRFVSTQFQGTCDFTGGTFIDSIFKDIIISGLPNEPSQQISFYKATFNDSTFEGTTSDGILIKFANMGGVKFEGATLKKVKINDSILSHSHFNKATLMACEILRSNLNNSEFKNAKIEDTSFSGDSDTSLELALSGFKYAKLKNVRFEKVNAQEGDFESATFFENCVMDNVRLTSANFKYANIARLDILGSAKGNTNFQNVRFGFTEIRKQQKTRLVGLFGKEIMEAGKLIVED